MVAPSSDKVVKSVSRKLKHYFEVKRLEDGFDLSGVDAPKLDHPPLKARPTLQYDGLHDRPLKHYFDDRGVRVRLTKWVAPPSPPKQKQIKRRMLRYMDDMKFVHPYLPDYSYIHYPRGKMILRPQYQGFGSQLPKTKKPHKGGYPVLRSRPSHQVSKSEASRLVDMSSRLLANSQCMDQERASSSQGSRRQSSGKKGSKKRSQSARAPKYVYDIHGRRVKADPTRYDEEARLCDHHKAESRQQNEEDSEKYNYVSDGDPDDKPMPRWLKREIEERDRDEGEDIQKRYVRPDSSAGSAAGRPGSGRPGSGRPGSGRPGSGRPGSGRPGSRGSNGSNGRPGSALRDRTSHTRVSDDPGRNVLEHTAVQTDLDLVEYNNVKDRIVDSGIKAKYRVFVRTGMKLGASTDADVFITLYGTKGRTEEIVLLDSKSHKAKFRKSQLVPTAGDDMPLSRLVWMSMLQEDEFHIYAYHVGEIKHIRIGHNRKELGAGWYLENVVVVDLHDRISYTFPCNRWLSYREEDQKTKRVLESSQQRNLPPDSELTDSEDGGSRSPSPLYSSPSTRNSSPTRPYAPTPISGRPDSSHNSMSPNAGTGSPQKVGGVRSPDDFEFSDSDKDDVNKPDQVKKADKDNNDDYMAGYRAGLAAARGGLSDRPSSPAKSNNTTRSGPEPKSQTSQLSSETDTDYCIHTAAKRGDLDLVKSILNKHPHLINAISEHGYTAIHLASANGHIDLLKWLAINCADLDCRTKKGLTVIHLAAQNGQKHCLMVLNAIGADLNVYTYQRQTPLHLAAAHGHRECCEWLLENGLAIGLRDSQGHTALDLAQQNDHNDVVDFLKSRIPHPPSEKRPSDGSGSESLTCISEETRPNRETSSQIVEPSETYTERQGTIISQQETTISSSTPRIDLAPDDPVHDL